MAQKKTTSNSSSKPKKTTRAPQAPQTAADKLDYTSIIQRGITELIKEHPSYNPVASYLANEVSQGKLYQQAKRLVPDKFLGKKNESQRIKHAENVLAKQISKGNKAYFEKGAHGILNARGAARKQADNSYKALIELKRYLTVNPPSKGDFKPALQSIENALGSAQYLPMMDIFSNNNVGLTYQQRKARAKIVNAQNRGARETLDNIVGEYKKSYAVPIILTITGGLLVALSNLNITGAVIGTNDYKSTASLIGAGLILIALFLFLKIRIKSRKVNKKPKAVVSKKKSKKSSKAKKRR